MLGVQQRQTVAANITTKTKAGLRELRWGNQNQPERRSVWEPVSWAMAIDDCAVSWHLTRTPRCITVLGQLKSQGRQAIELGELSQIMHVMVPVLRGPLLHNE